MVQHAKVHFFADRHIGIHHEQGQDGSSQHGHHEKDKSCELCLFAKGFNDALTTVPLVLLAAVFQHDFTPLLIQSTKQHAQLRNYLARAPPIFLS